MTCIQPHRLRCLLLIVAIAAAPRGWAADWLTLPSTFTHDPVTGCRVNQFAAVDAPPQNDQSQLIASGYTNYRSSIQVGQSADHYYRVNQWGPPVRPYGEWLFPYRPYSSPYDAWGAPFAGLNLGFGGGFGGPHYFGPQPGQGGAYPGGHPGRPGFPGPHPGGGIPGQPINPYPIYPGGAHREPPWYDGFHPEYPLHPRLNDRDFYRRP
jgi:hypothetical protein